MLWSAVILGLASSLHCVGMCGPLQFAALGTFRGKNEKYHIILYHLSRIFTYGMLGLLAGFIGKGAGLESWQQQTSLLSGLLLLFAFAGFYLLKIDKKLMKILFPYINRMNRKLRENRSARFLYFSGSGVMNGLLPCGMVYLAIFPAMTTGQPLLSFLYMILFGLGTLPLLFLTNIGAYKILGNKSKLIRKVIPVMVVITAVLLILRGMDLGIPFISPEKPVAAAGLNTCH